MAKGLGRGLDALFTKVDVEKEDVISEANVEELRPNPYQPRKHFDDQAIQELSESIKQHGVVQPLIVRKSIRESSEACPPRTSTNCDSRVY
jgi:ParB family chromosome partitioning protein